MTNIRAKLILGDTFHRKVVYVKANILPHTMPSRENTITLPDSVHPATLFVPNGNGDNPTDATLVFFMGQNHHALKIRINYNGSPDGSLDSNLDGSLDRVRTLTFTSEGETPVDDYIKHICNHTRRVKFEPLNLPVEGNNDVDDGNDGNGNGNDGNGSNIAHAHRGTVIADAHAFNADALTQAKSSYTPPLSLTDAPPYIGIIMQRLQSIDNRLAALEEMLQNKTNDTTHLADAHGLVVSRKHITLTTNLPHSDSNGDSNASSDNNGEIPSTFDQGRSLLLLATFKHGNISMTFQLPCDIVKATKGANNTIWLKCAFWELGADVAEEVEKYIFYHDRQAVGMLSGQA